ncbi:calmodulin-binding transcription activator 6 isoform X2 [Magnolia sinica]|uniref:calmodulin-binding transcription activator 6 isoform X2 n=1 Tax=Magnolia sinica TaxID=86752 RepID=UPI00265A9F66|nr:calmodulin-binding transcription activator 6 isoform X2 [Magnolia sinica]
MESSVSRPLTGTEIHGFHTMEDLDVVKMKEEAASRWLRPNEIHAILCNYAHFNINVKPVDLPPSGTIVLFDRKMLRNFRKDGHNWKKKKDGKTVKEAHEHLKVGNLDRIHVYYAHGQDNPNFVRRIYWLLDKKLEHVVLVHYREVLEDNANQSFSTPKECKEALSLSNRVLHGPPFTPVNSNSGSLHSDTSGSAVVSDEIDSGADCAFYAGSGTSLLGESTELGDQLDESLIARNKLRLHEINTLDWSELLETNDDINSAAPRKDEASSFDQQRANELQDSKSNNTLQTQDSFGIWMKYIVNESPGGLRGLPPVGPMSTDHASGSPVTMEQSLPQEQVFSITDVSPAWASSTEETKVILIGHFHEGHTHLASSTFYCVFGDLCAPAEMVQVGVFRCMARPQTPGLVTFYLTLDGNQPISQVLSFEYRSISISHKNNGLDLSEADESKWEDLRIQIRLSRLLFSTTNITTILSNKILPNAIKQAKKFSSLTPSYEKKWMNFIESVETNKESFSEATHNLFELSLKNKFQEWLLERVVEGCKTTARDHKGQGVIHLCAMLGYTWAVNPFVHSGLSLDFRDACGWTALHWAAYYGRERMVAVLLSAEANPSLVTDPTPKCPGGYTAADLASIGGHDGLAAYLAEKGLLAHFQAMSISGNITGTLQASTTDLDKLENLNEEELCMKDSLAAYRNAADAAARIQVALRENALKVRTKAVQLEKLDCEEYIIAALKIQHAFRNYNARKRMAAAVRIQHRFRTWKIRREFLNMRRQVIKIQAAFRGHQVRRQYRKILWSVGVLEKAVLRWRLKRKGLRGLQVEPAEPVTATQAQENDVEEDFYRISRKHAEDRVERSVVRVQAMFRSYQAQKEYRRMKLVFDQAQFEHDDF